MDIDKELVAIVKKIKRDRALTILSLPFYLIASIVVNTKLGIRCLHFACKWNCQRIVNFLVSCGINVNAKDKERQYCYSFGSSIWTQQYS